MIEFIADSSKDARNKWLDAFEEFCSAPPFDYEDKEFLLTYYVSEPSPPWPVTWELFVCWRKPEQAVMCRIEGPTCLGCLILGLTQNSHQGVEKFPLDVRELHESWLPADLS